MYFRGSGNGRERGMFRQIYLALITMKQLGMHILNCWRDNQGLIFKDYNGIK